MGGAPFPPLKHRYRYSNTHKHPPAHAQNIRPPQTEKYGVFDCKPLAFIWAKFPDHYNPDNTVMLDDLRCGLARDLARDLRSATTDNKT